MVYFGQTVGWITMPLDTELDLGSGDIVLDGDPASLRKGEQRHPTFRPTFIVAKLLEGSGYHPVQK